MKPVLPLVALALLLGGCRAAPRTAAVDATVSALAFEDAGALFVGRADGTVERRDEKLRVTASWSLEGRIDAMLAGEGGVIVAANTKTGEGGVPRDCVVTRTGGAAPAEVLATFPEGCRALAQSGDDLLAAGLGGMVAKITAAGDVAVRHEGAGIIRTILSRDHEDFVAGQSSHGGFVTHLGGWSVTFGSGYFDVAKDLELRPDGILQIVGSRKETPDDESLEGFVASVARDGSGFSLERVPDVTAVHQIDGANVVGHSQKREITLGACSLASHGGGDAYVGRLDAEGRLVSAWVVGSEEDEYGYAIAVSPDGRVAAGGMRGADARGWLALFPRAVTGCGSLALP